MAGRKPNEKLHEISALDQAHIQNETSRDSFIGLGHTALFASSISFVGDVMPIRDAVFLPLLIFGWFIGVVGLLALASSFGAASKAIDSRRQAINDHNPPHSQFAERLNSVAIWTFPIALLSIFLFVSVNVVYSNDDKFKATSAAELRDVRCKPAASGTQHRIPAKAEYRCNSGTASTGDASPKASESTGQGLESTNPPLN